MDDFDKMQLGIDKRNDILAALTLSYLRNLAAVIAMPDRLTPGMREKICKNPIIKADLRSKLISRFFSFPFLSEKYSKIPNVTVVHPIILSDLKSSIIPDSAIKYPLKIIGKEAIIMSIKIFLYIKKLIISLTRQKI